MSATDTNFCFCEICNREFDTHSLYACIQGHFFCKSCFNRKYCKGNEKRCPDSTCKALIDDKHIQRSGGEPSRISNKMFHQPSLYSQAKRTPFHTDTASSNPTFTSKRPLRCPLKNCNRCVSVVSLDSHFQYEHNTVASIDTVLEARNGVDFLYNDLKLNEVSCIVVIKIKETEQLPSASASSASVKYADVIPQPTLLVLAARIATSRNQSDFEDLSDEKVFVWIGSNIKTKFSYTLALSTECSRIRIKYYGPLSTINDDYETLCSEGRGLLLTKEQVMNLTEKCTRLMSLDILIHCPK